MRCHVMNVYSFTYVLVKWKVACPVRLFRDRMGSFHLTVFIIIQ